MSTLAVLILPRRHLHYALACNAALIQSSGTSRIILPPSREELADPRSSQWLGCAALRLDAHAMCLPCDAARQLKCEIVPTDHDSTVALAGPTYNFTFALGRPMFHIAFRVAVIPVSKKSSLRCQLSEQQWVNIWQRKHWLPVSHRLGSSLSWWEPERSAGVTVFDSRHNFYRALV